MDKKTRKERESFFFSSFLLFLLFDYKAKLYYFFTIAFRGKGILALDLSNLFTDTFFLLICSFHHDQHQFSGRMIQTSF
jgi:hypothetical protein